MPIAPRPSGSADLTPHYADVIRTTLPLVSEKMDAIARTFYHRMFEGHPELLRNQFNRGNQAQGDQQRSLAASIATYATYLVSPELPHPAELFARIGHKHVSLGVTAQQYLIVHEHLFAAIVEELGADTVTTAVADAWDRVYWMMANTLIGMEQRLYEVAGVAPGDVFGRGTVARRVDDPSGVVIITVRTPRPLTAPGHPGQYVSVGITLPDGARQLRQYSLLAPPADNELTFAVKPVVPHDAHPAGEVSTWIADHLREGDLVDVSIPFGDLPTTNLGDHPLVLISAGIGITPMIGILTHLARGRSACSVQVLHADTSATSHPLRAHQRWLVDELPNATLELWYAEADDDAGTPTHSGRLDLTAVAIPDSASIYLCGSPGFVLEVRRQLLAKQIVSSRIHCELFLPNHWLLS